MISLKKYLDMDRTTAVVAEPEREELFPATMECYRAVLGAIGKRPLTFLLRLARTLKRTCSVWNIAFQSTFLPSR